MPLCSESRHLVYTIAFDPPNSPGHRMMAKMLASSLLRTYFGGDVMIFRNSPEPLFRVERKGLEEIYVDATQMGGLEGFEDAWCWKYRVREHINAENYDKILFLDADCLALRNLDHLLEGNWDLAYQTESGLNITYPQFSAFLTNKEMKSLNRSGINSGHLAVRGEVFQDVMVEWERIDTGPVLQERGCLDQGSWNRLILNAEASYQSNGENWESSETACPPWKAVHFERGEIQFPMYLDTKAPEYSEAALVHCLGGNTREKLRFMFGLYMSTFFYDDTSMLVNLLEI